MEIKLKHLVAVLAIAAVAVGGWWFYQEHQRLLRAEAAFAYLSAEVGKTEDKRSVRVGDIIQRLVSAELEKLTVKPAGEAPAPITPPLPKPIKKD